VVLDACRLDYFTKLNSLSGYLTPIEVQASCTINWLKHYFPGKYPYQYVSSNPFCNSITEVHGYFGRDHFARVVDVWKTHWDEKLMTVPPARVTKVATRYLYLYRKTIIHYMQPHLPGIGKTRVMYEAWRPSPGRTVVDKTHPRSFEEVHLNLLRKAYEENLAIVLEEIRNNLLPRIPEGKKVVLTADHGELLGEDGMLFHPCGVRHPLLNRVFWFELER
jgi:hypothetical protein